MGIIKTVHLIYEYIRHDEEEKVAEVKRAIDGVDLEIEEGSFTAILGHNGSGKSTLAKHINGLLLPTEGTVWVGEIDTKEEEPEWSFKILIIRSLEISWRKTWALVLKISVFPQMRSGSGWMRA